MIASSRPPTHASIAREREDNKRAILRLARNGSDRPSTKSSDANERRLAGLLSAVSKRSNILYDPAFLTTVKNAAPRWFIAVNENKSELLRLASSGADRPGRESKLGRALQFYIDKSCGSYDGMFDRRIHKTAPIW